MLSEGSVLRCPGEDYSLGQSGVLDVLEGCYWSLEADSEYCYAGLLQVLMRGHQCKGRSK